MRLLRTLIISICIWTISDALPFNEAPKLRKRLTPRSKPYSIVNVEGEATQPAATVVETVALPAPVETETIRVTDVAPPIATITVIPTPSPEKLPLPPPAPVTTPSPPSTTSSSSSVSSSSSTPPPQTAAPSTISSSVVATTSQTSSTQTYDDGMWHTSYLAKAFDTVSLNATATSVSSMEMPSSSLLKTSPVSIPTSLTSYNQTHPVGRLRVRSRLSFS